jgi:pimeloyl-ACP methyl ester carboxylesterase
MIGEAGLSVPVRPDLAGDAHARWLDDVFAGLGLTRAAFVGMSLGGWLALDYAVRRPGAVTALALICPAGIGRQKNFLLKAAPLLLLGPWGKRRMREFVFGPMPAELPEERRSVAELAELIGKAIRPRVVRIPLLSDEELGALRIPLLAILGGRDVLIDTRHARERLERCAPQAEVRFLDDGYHFLPNQAERVMDFLERRAASG